MNKLVIGVVLLVAVAAIWFLSQVPEQPSVTVEVEVISLADVPGKPGRRVITVRFANGREEAIETLTPFFYKPGYTAKVGVFERTLFPDVYDFVSASSR